ncbi:MAG: pyridoxal-phosphate dependent enzyme [Deltaproteobacteria bacterium]|nr:pyridoxal-phosphate dependent enzyme [Deltaproteobacteria bacterium]
MIPAIDEIRRAAARIAPHAHRTPVMRCRSLDAMSGAELFFKCENLQRAGAFKFRGAVNAVLSLPAERAARGVASHSSGNHAAALALAARVCGVPCRVVMPRGAPAVKQAAVRGYGAEIRFCEPSLQAREQGLAELVADSGAAVIHPYDDEAVIAGQGTAALELVEEVADLDLLLCPVGGGGLASGTAIAAHGASPRTRVVAVEPAGADDARRSFRQGRLLLSVAPDTIADGLLTSLSERTFGIIRALVHDVVCVDDAAIARAMRLVFERMKLVIEPSAAVPLAALLEGRLRCAGQRVGIILSGGNVDLGRLATLDMDR